MGGVISFFIGAVLASFACVIAERLGTREGWMRSRSRCNACARTLDARDLVPVVSYIVFRGRCRVCTSKIPASYTIAEIVLGSVFLLLSMQHFPAGLLAAWYVFSFLLTILVVYDLRHTIVPFKLSLLLVALGGGIGYLSTSLTPERAVICLVAAGIGMLFFLLHILSSGRWMGLGDAPVALALSLAVGKSALSGLLFSFWSGAVVGVFILVLVPSGRRMNTEVPFIPFLAFGYLLAFFTQWNPFMIL